MEKTAVAALAAAFALGADAAIETISPAEGSEYRLLHSALKNVIAYPTKEARYDALSPESAGWDDPLPDLKDWRHPRPVVVKWRTTEGEKGPWLVRLSEREDFSSPLDFVCNGDKDGLRREKLENGVSEWTY